MKLDELIQIGKESKDLPTSIMKLKKFYLSILSPMIQIKIQTESKFNYFSNLLEINMK